MPIMKKFQNSAVSVLLFSFLFLVIHDFAIMKIDPGNHYETSSKVTHLSDEIHKSIDTLFAIASDEAPAVYYLLSTFKQNTNIFIITQNYNDVLERPPLS